MICGRTLTGACVVWVLSGVLDAAQLDRTTVPTRPNPREGLELSPPAPSVLPDPGLDEGVVDGRLVGGPTVFVREIDFVGATVLTEDDFEPLRARYADRDVTFEELLRLRDEATLLYVNRGYPTSGATIGTLTDGVLTVELTEGTIAEIQISSGGRYRDDYLNDYLESFGPMDPVNVFSVEERLQILQSGPHVERIEAQLLPGQRRGESILYVRPYEAEPLRLLFEASNQLSPAVGSGQVLATLDYLNLRGRADDVHLGIRAAEGLTELAADYDFPLNARDTRMTVYGFGADSEIVTSPFDKLDIEAKSRTYGVRVSHPIRRSLTTRSGLFLNGEWRQSKTYLLGSGFSFIEGPDDGKVEIAVLRAGWEHSHRTSQSVLAWRTQLSFGLDAFGATNAPSGSPSSTPDADFIVFLGQLQWAQRIGFLDSQFIARLDVQLANGPLFGIEQIPIGGRWTVRGYRENTLIRDSGVVGSIEWRTPLLVDVMAASRLEIGPFVDWAYSWNESRGEIGPKNITSAGLGLKWRPTGNTELETFWGYSFDDIDYPDDDDLQDDGFHLRFRWWGE